MRIGISILLIFFQCTVALGQSDSAHDSAASEMLNDFQMGGSSLAAGAEMMYTYCGTAAFGTVMMCALGAGAAAGGVMNIATGLGRKESIDKTRSYETPTGCLANPYGPGCGGNNNNSDGDTLDTQAIPKTDPSTIDVTALPPAVAEVYRNAVAAGQKYGVDITDPKSVEAFKAKMAAAGKSGGGGGDDGSGSSAGMASLTPEQQAKIEAAKDKFLAKFKVSSVALEGGGGRMDHGRSSGQEPNLDLNSLLNRSDDTKRKIASIDGLQKTLGDDPIGVAGDNIFHQVSRRYQTKIQSQSFLTK